MKQYIFFSIVLFSFPVFAYQRLVDDKIDNPQEVEIINDNFRRIDSDKMNAKKGTSGNPFTNLYASSVTITNPNSILNYNIGSLNTPAGTGNVSYTGIGFMPRLLIFTANRGTGLAMEFGMGYCMSSSTQVAAFGGGLYDTGIGAGPLVTNYCLQNTENSGSIIMRASLVSMDTSGFTLNWETVPGNTQGVGYIAFQ